MADDGGRSGLSDLPAGPELEESRRDNSMSSSGQYGASSVHSIETPRRRPAQAQAQTDGYGSIPSSVQYQSITSPEPTPQRPPQPKRPGHGRRATSHGPVKGQEFSVDDAESEVQEDMAQQRHAVKVSGSLRRQPSTIRRRQTTQVPTLPKVDSAEDEEEDEPQASAAPSAVEATQISSVEEATLQEDDANSPDDDDEDLSDAESFTLKDRQEAINVTHPFGIRIWKPALYKKSRSVQKNAEGDIHSSPGLHVSNWLVFWNFAWTIIFGWWMAAIAFAGGLICIIFGCVAGSCVDYGRVLLGLSGYLFYPFGKYVKLMQEEAYAEEDEGEGRSISEYEQWQAGDIEEGRLFFGPINTHRPLVGRRRNSVDSADETQSLLGRTPRGGLHNRNYTTRTKRRLFGRGQWTLGRITFFIFFYGLITPSLFLVSAICWLLVFSIPMGRVTLLLFDHLRRHPLALSFHSDSSETRYPGAPASSIIVCTYRAVGSRYWKYTIDGTNIFLINLLGIVAFVIFDYWVLAEALKLQIALTSQGLIFVLALLSIIPLAYFIGQAVASISAQSSMGVGATVNAFFSTVVEVFLYCVALGQGKAQLVEGSIIGSIFAGILFLPGLSMCFGALKRKTQRFNVKSAGVTSTMLLFAVIGAFSPTLFFQIYGSHELKCRQCVEEDFTTGDRDCRRCFFTQTPAVYDRFYNQAIKPYIWFSATTLFLSYVIGLLFTLRTHAAVIWNSELDEKKTATMDNSFNTGGATSEHTQYSGPQDSLIFNKQDGLSRQNAASNLPRNDIRDSQLYKRILGHSLRQAGVSSTGEQLPIDTKRPRGDGQTPHMVPPRSWEDTSPIKSDSSRHPSGGLHISSLSEEDNQQLARQVAEMAATAAAVAARDSLHAPRKTSQLANTSTSLVSEHVRSERPAPHRTTTFEDPPHEIQGGEGGVGHASGGGHDAPNWSRTKSVVVLLTATIAYAIIAEILVNTVDGVLDNVDIDEKFLGITLFALVPNTTEFLNAISFAMNGNIALSMEIGSAYALQVCLLQIPALVLYSGAYGRFISPEDVIDHTFTLIFPQWDMVTVILCVFLLSYMYGEGKSNYFKGSILILSYLVVVVGFYFSGYNNEDLMGIDSSDTLALKRHGRFISGKGV